MSEPTVFGPKPSEPFDVLAYLAEWAVNHEPLRMYGYYYAFEATGVREVDMILSSVAIAGKRYHLTEDWNEETPGPAPVDVIQAAANLAASSVSRMRAAVGDDASGRTFSELLTEAAARLACLGDGPMVDCLRLKAEQLREIE